MLLLLLFSEYQKLAIIILKLKKNSLQFFISLWRPVADCLSFVCFSKGVLKDYLRELPSPLITKQLYEAVLDAMAKNPLKMSSSGCENDLSDSKYTVDLLDRLPDVEKVSVVVVHFSWKPVNELCSQLQNYK